MAVDPLAGLAPKEAVPRFRSAAPLAELGLGPDEGFVLSRVDGVTRLGELLNLVPFEPPRTVEIVRRLWLAGAIEIPGHAPPVLAGKADERTGDKAVPTAVPVASGSGPTLPTAVPVDVELTLEQVRHIDRFFSQIRTRNAFELLGVPRAADKREIKRAYFKLSKEFHPDRFFGKSLGVYADRLAQSFGAIKSAFDLLSDDARRAAYEDSIGPSPG